MRTPSTPAEQQIAAALRFNSELALFLLVATEYDFWIYSWFWDWDNYVPGSAESTVPMAFYPEAKCKVGTPSGLMKKLVVRFLVLKTYRRSPIITARIQYQR